LRRALDSAAAHAFASFNAFTERIGQCNGDPIEAAQSIAADMRPSARTRARRDPWVKMLRANAGDFRAFLATITAICQLAAEEIPAWDLPEDIDDPASTTAADVARTFGIETIPGACDSIADSTPDQQRKLGLHPEELRSMVAALSSDDISDAFDLCSAVVTRPSECLVELEGHNGNNDVSPLAGLLGALVSHSEHWRGVAMFVAFVAQILHKLRDDEITRRFPGITAELETVIGTARTIASAPAI
jgi:hypothetical protein